MNRDKLIIIVIFVISLFFDRKLAAQNGFYFDGSDDYGYNNSVPIGTDNFTIEGWIYINNLPATHSWMVHSDGSNLGVGIDSAGLCYSTNGSQYRIDASLALNNWNHIALVRDNGTFYIYLNGVSLSINSGEAPSSSTTGIYIGSGGTSEYFNGIIDEIRIWNVVRSATDIADYYNKEVSASSSGLTAYYKFDQGVSESSNTGINTITDSTSNAYNCTLSNVALSGTTSNWVTGYPFRSTQTITFNAISDKIYGDSDFDPGATVSSDLTVTYTSSNTVIASIVNNQVHILSAGSCTIYANQPGNSSYYPATKVSQSLTINKGSATVTLGGLNQIYDGTSKAATAVTSPTGLTVSLTYDGSATEPVGAGQYDVVGTVSDDNYSGSANGVLTIYQAPFKRVSGVAASVITSVSASINWTPGDGSYCAVFMSQTTSGSPAPADGTEYTAGSTFGAGTQIASSGWYCIYNGTGNSVDVTALSAYTSYRVMVVGYNGTSDYSVYLTGDTTNNPVNFTTLLSAPVASSASSVGYTGFTANWGTVSDATTYYLDVSTNSGFSSFVSGFNNLLVGNVLTYSVTGLNTSTTYYYRVRSSDGSVSSDNSNVISIVTLPTTTYSGGSWTGGTPSSALDAVFADDFTVGSSSSGIDIDADNITVNSGVTLTIQPGHYVIAAGDVVIDGTLIIESSSSGEGSFICLGSLTQSGTVQVQRYLTGSGWHLVSSPLSNATSGVFTGLYLMPFSESSNAFSSYVTSTSASLSPGVGYAVWAPSATTSVFSGTLNQSTVSVSCPYTNAGFTLVGNPFSSAIDWDASGGWTKTNLSSSIWVWNSSSSQYSVWNGSNGTNGGSQYLSLGQGFFVQSTSSGSISMTKDVQVFNTVSLKSDKISQGVLRAKVSGNNSSDEIVVMQVDDSKSVPDSRYDAQKMWGGAGTPQLFTVKANKYMSIASIGSIDSTLQIPVNLHVGKAGIYTLEINNSLESGSLPVLLHDNKTSSDYSISESFSQSFECAVGDDSSRFVISFRTAVTHLPVTGNIAGNISFWNKGNVLYFSIPDNDAVKNIEIFDLKGCKLKSFGETTNQSISLDINSGVYIVKIITCNNIKTGKIQIH